MKAFLNQPLQVENLKFNQLTIKAWSTLWALESPFTLDSDKISQADIDLLLYAVNAPSLDDYEELVRSSIDYCKKLEIDENLGKYVCFTLVNLAFAPLRLFPQNSVKLTAGETPLYDSDWIASIVSKVHAQTGASAERIINQMSLNSCCAYFVDWARMQGQKGIGRKSDAQIIQEIDSRCNEIIIDRLIEKGDIKPEDREYYTECFKRPNRRKAGFKIREP